MNFRVDKYQIIYWLFFDFCLLQIQGINISQDYLGLKYRTRMYGTL